MRGFPHSLGFARRVARQRAAAACWLALLLSLPLSVQAAPSTRADLASGWPDAHEIEAVKHRALDAMFEAANGRQWRLLTGGDEPIVMLASEMPSFRIEVIRVRAKDQLVLERRYGADANRALRKGGWQPLWTMSAATVDGHFDVEIEGAYISEPAINEPAAVVFSVEPKPHAEAIVLTIDRREHSQRQRRQGVDVLQMSEHADAAEPICYRFGPAPKVVSESCGESVEPLVRAARYARYKRDLLAAYYRLREARGLPAAAGDQSLLHEEGIVLEKLGLLAAGARAADALHRAGDKSAAGALELELARRYAYRGEEGRAQALLSGLGENEDMAVAASARALAAQLQLRAGDAKSAVEAYAAVPPAHRAPFDDYNHAMALLRAGQHSVAMDRLASLAKRPVENNFQRVLSDKARLLAGRVLLQADRSGEAAAQLRAVQTRGPYTAPALLALGWAVLLDAAPPQARRFRNVPQSREGSPPSDTEGETTFGSERRALHLWRLAAETEPGSLAAWRAAFQSARLMQAVGAHSRAHDGYEALSLELREQAAHVQEIGHAESLHRLLERFAATGDARAFGAAWSAAAIPESLAAPWARDTTASNHFAELLREWRDFRLLDKALAQRNEAELRDQVALIRDKLGAYLVGQLKFAVARHGEALEEILARCLMGLADIQGAFSGDGR